MWPKRSCHSRHSSVTWLGTLIYGNIQTFSDHMAMLSRLACTAPTQPCQMKSHAGVPRSRSKTASPPLSSIQPLAAPNSPLASCASAFNQIVIGELRRRQTGLFYYQLISALSCWNQAHMKNCNAKNSVFCPLQALPPMAPTMPRSTRHSLTREMSHSKSPAVFHHRTLHRIKLFSALVLKISIENSKFESD